MARRNSNFMIGFFVTVGIVIGVAAIIWVGASQYFEKGSLYVTYFDESVQGLQVDSRVKYRGVDIGKVESIGVAADGKLVEVVMKIALKVRKEENIVTQLRAAGITGIVFIELDRAGENTPILTPPSGMEVRYPVIASQTSQGKQIMTAVDQIMGKIEHLDLKGISDQLKQTLRVAEAFLAGSQMKGLLTKLDSTADTLDRGLKRIDRVLEEGKVEGILEETRQGLQETRQGIRESRETIADARELVAVFQQEIKSLKAAETAEKAGRLIDGLDRKTRGISADVERTTDEIRQAVESLKLLLDRLHDNPSDLIFSRPVLDDGERGEATR
ncbi:MAG: MlaD family protein [Syntrophales bacterium]|jgi:phospholipid/cholesterol/gamma-HCH transport system substrate-binding protein|nr:MlaD family protein [Syntrophales bacterium]